MGWFTSKKNDEELKKISDEKNKLTISKVHMRVDEFLRRFIYEGGFEIKLPAESNEN